MNQCTSSLKIHWWRYKFLCCSSMHKVALTWYFSILNPRFGSHMIDISGTSSSTQSHMIDIPRTSSSTHREPPDTSMACWGMQLKAWVHRWMPNGEKKFQTTSMNVSKIGLKPKVHRSCWVKRKWKLHRWNFTETQNYIDEPSQRPKSTSMDLHRNPKVHRWTVLGTQKYIDESWLGTKTTSMKVDLVPKTTLFWIHLW